MQKKLLVVSCLICMTLFVSCNALPSTNDPEGVLEEYYETEDFATVVIGESTFQDVYAIAPTDNPMQVTSYGCFCEYPMQNGGCIRIKFYGKNMVVGAIEELPPIAE